MPDYVHLTPNALISSIGEKLKLNPLLGRMTSRMMGSPAKIVHFVCGRAE